MTTDRQHLAEPLLTTVATLDAIRTAEAARIAESDSVQARAARLLQADGWTVDFPQYRVGTLYVVVPDGQHTGRLKRIKTMKAAKAFIAENQNTPRVWGEVR